MTDPTGRIAMSPALTRVRAQFQGHIIADSDDAVILREAGLAPVVYFPVDDVEMAYLGRTDHRTHCPYKGDAGYWSLVMEGEVVENAAWAYETPNEGMGALAGRIAFDASRIEVYEIDEAALEHGAGHEASRPV